MSDEVTPNDVVKLIERISINSKSSRRRFRILRCFIKRCFIRKPYLLESFVSIGGTEALVNLAHSSRKSSKSCGDSIIRLLHHICRDLKEPLHGIGLMIKLCELLKEEDQTLSGCRLFLAVNAEKWVRKDKHTCLHIITSLFIGVKSDLTKHLEDRELNRPSSKVFVLYIFSCKFYLICEELKENTVIKNLCNSIMELMDSLLPKYSEVSFDEMEEYCYILEVVSSVGMFSGGIQKFHEVLASRVDEFRYLVLKYYGDSWLEQNAWGIRYMGLKMEDKLRYAYTILPQINNAVKFNLFIRRSKILEYSEHYLMTAELKKLQGDLTVKFIGEPGYGDGPVREWFVLFIEEMVNRKLFSSCSADMRKILPTREHLDDCYIFTAAGVLIGMALMHKVHLGIKLDTIVHASLAEREIRIEDVKDTDPQLYNSWMKFAERESVNVVVDGEADGEADDLVQDSFDDFVASLSEKLRALRLGLDFAIGCRIQRLSFFRAIEPDVVDALLLGDSEELSIDDWKSHTEVKGCCKTDPRIPWLWKVLTDMSPEDTRNFLFFWTAVRYLPPRGFGGLPMHLTIVLGAEKERLPTSFTCFFQLNLPMFSSYESLEECLQRIVREPFEFGLE